MSRRSATRLGGLAALFVVVSVLLWMGPAGSAYRANDDLAACVERAELQGASTPGGEFGPEYVAAVADCAVHCERLAEPSWLETVGLFVQTRLSTGRDGPSCVDQPGFSDVIPFLPDP